MKSKKVKSKKAVKEIKGKRGRPKKDIAKKIVETSIQNLDLKPYKPVMTPNQINTTETHSFCPDCGTELMDIKIHDEDYDTDMDAYGCPNCQQEVTKDNEVTLTINKDGMRLDYNSLEVVKIIE